MEFFRRLREWLSFRPRRTIQYGNPDLHPIDPAGLEEELGVEKEAERLGSNDLPRTNAVQMTGIEHHIVQKVEKARQDYAAWAAARLKVHNHAISSQDLTQLANRALHADAEFERKANALLADHVPNLNQEAHHVRDLTREYNDFRDQNGLTRAPRYPENNKAFLGWAILLALVVIEGALNATFFAQGLLTGLVGGFIYAAVLALINVAAASFIGYFGLRQFNHRHPARKLLGALALPIALCVAAFFALLIAHFRDTLSSGAVDASAVAYAALRQDPLGLKDLSSWMLFAVTIIFALIALIDSYRMDDPYPGYGAIHRRLKRATTIYEHDMQHFRDNLAQLKNDSIGELDRFAEKARVSLRMLHEAIEQKAYTESRLKIEFANVDNCLTLLLNKFRTSNEIYRQSPVPAYFSEFPRLRELDLPDFNCEGDWTKYAEQEAMVKRVEDALERKRASVQASFLKHFDALTPIDEHFPSTPEPVT